MPNEPSDPMRVFGDNPHLIDQAIGQGVRNALASHADAGQPVYVRHDGRDGWVDPSDMSPWRPRNLVPPGGEILERVPVASTAIVSVGYNAATGVLHVEWAPGDVERFYEVPEDTHQALLQATSPGTFVVEVLKPAFRHEPFRRADALGG